MNAFLVLLCIIAGIGGFILLCHAIIQIDNAYKAWVQTRKWQKEKNRRLNNPESAIEGESLMTNAADADNIGSDNNHDIELELQLDLVGLSEEEREAKIKARQEESQPDWHLTTKEKFVKEFKIAKNAWELEQAKKAEAKAKEQEVKDEEARLERLTKEAVREVANKKKKLEFQQRLDEAVGKELERMGLDRDGNSVAESSSGAGGAGGAVATADGSESDTLPTYDHAMSKDV